MKRKDSELRPTKGGKAGAIKERAAEEFRHFVVLFLYLWVFFGLFVLDKTVVTRQEGLSFLPHGFALINALVLAKVMLVSESLDLARWMNGKPAAWSIVYESALCTILFIIFHIIEEWAVGRFRGTGIAAGTPSIGGGGWLGLFVVALILFVSLLPFFAFKNVTRAIGARRMKEILFQSPRIRGRSEDFP